MGYEDMKGIIFDLDGTLCDSMDSWYGVAGRILAGMGVQRPLNAPYIRTFLYLTVYNAYAAGNCPPLLVCGKWRARGNLPLSLTSIAPLNT